MKVNKVKETHFSGNLLFPMVIIVHAPQIFKKKQFQEWGSKRKMGKLACHRWARDRFWFQPDTASSI